MSVCVCPENNFQRNGLRRKGKSKGRVIIHSATYMVDQEQRALTVSEVAVDWQEPTVLQRKCGHPLPALTGIGPAVAASKHTTALNQPHQAFTP